MQTIFTDNEINRIKKNQKFLLKLLHFHIGSYYPLRKYLGIDYKGKIDEISHLSIAYNTKKVKEGYQQTRTYQHPDLGYKLNLILDKIPQLALLPALLQPAYGLGALMVFILTETTYQPSTKDSWILNVSANTNYGSNPSFRIGATTYNYYKALLYFNLSDIKDNATFSDAILGVNCKTTHDFDDPQGNYYLCRLLRANWTENGVTWNKYDGVNEWTTGGASSDGNDYTSIYQLTKVAPFSQAIGWKYWTSAKNLIQYCWDNTSKGIHLLIWFDKISGKEMNEFYSKEEAVRIERRPKLTVTFISVVGPFPTFRKL